MHLLEPSPGTLLLAAIAAIVALMAVSDFDPPQEVSLGDVGEDPAELSVMVRSCRPCTGGFLLNISDGAGGEVKAFCPSDVLSAALPDGTSATVTVQRSSDDPGFFVVSDLRTTGSD